MIPVMIEGTYPDNFLPALLYEVAADGTVTDRPITLLGADARETGDGKAPSVSSPAKLLRPRLAGPRVGTFWRLGDATAAAASSLCGLTWQPSIDVRHEALTRYLRTLVVAIGLARRQRNLDGVQVIVRDSRQQMCDAIEPGLFLVVGVHHVPRAYLSVGLGEHEVFCL